MDRHAIFVNLVKHRIKPKLKELEYLSEYDDLITQKQERVVVHEHCIRMLRTNKDLQPRKKVQDMIQKEERAIRILNFQINRINEAKEEKINTFKDKNGRWIWPKQNGFDPNYNVARISLQVGQIIDRISDKEPNEDTGVYFSVPGVTWEARAMSPDSSKRKLRTYTVKKVIEVSSGIAKPAFGQPGLGIQFVTQVPLADLIRDEFLEEL